MPTYEFRCARGHSFDRFFRTMSSAHTTLPCPECGAMAERQLSGGAGLHFKGAGFYHTDYGKNAHRKTDVGRQTSDAGAKAETTGDAKPESAKPETAKSDKSEAAKAEALASKAESTSKGSAKSDGSTSSSTAGEPKAE